MYKRYIVLWWMWLEVRKVCKVLLDLSGGWMEGWIEGKGRSERQRDNS